MFKKIALSALVLGFTSNAFATSTIRCEGKKEWFSELRNGSLLLSYFIEYNVGTIGKPNRLLVGLANSDTFVSIQGDATSQITMYYSDGRGTSIQVLDEQYNSVISTLNTIRSQDGEVEAGVLTYYGESVAVTCEQVG